MGTTFFIFQAYQRTVFRLNETKMVTICTWKNTVLDTQTRNQQNKTRWKFENKSESKKKHRR